MSAFDTPIPLRTIALEEHFATPAFVDGPGRQLVDQARAAGYPQLIDQLCDLGAQRIAQMDASGIDTQVLSLTAPGVEQLAAAEAIPLARDANERLADALQSYPSRLAAFAALPTMAPDRAADELEHTVRAHGFVG